MIELKNLTKVFKKPIRKEGLLGMFSTLFSRKYEEKVAVNDISLTIADGEIIGYIGANGAGKSTTVKMMCGILTPTSGAVYIDGEEPYKKRRRIARKIGVVFGQKTQLWWDIPLIESFKVLKEIYQVDDKSYGERMEFLSSVLGIDEFLNQPVRTLSLGQRMRADLAAAWLHNPEILFLDEPTIGLDVLVKEKIRKAIKTMNATYGTTVILTTHDMKDIENLCSRIVMIEEGNIIYDGPLSSIKNKFGDVRTVFITLQSEPVLSDLENFDGRATYKWQDNGLYIKFNAEKLPVEAVVDYAFHTLKATDFKITEISIEDVVKVILDRGDENGKK
ncbi:MAG: ATP-binding cassette domain-containing protein [Clostridia bacterium]|nr:ATP-binding cassette domain-containing protein [Clostridia bacterium]